MGRRLERVRLIVEQLFPGMEFGWVYHHGGCSVEFGFPENIRPIYMQDNQIMCTFHLGQGLAEGRYGWKPLTRSSSSALLDGGQSMEWGSPEEVGRSLFLT